MNGMKSRMFVAGALVALVFAPVGGVAIHEESSCEITASAADLEAAGVAVFVDNADPEQGVSMWVYLESNGFDGIQRDDPVFTDELCRHEADTILL